MENKEVFLTAEGRRKLEEELEYLITVRRPEIASQIQAAKAEGDISENAGYEEAKMQQAFLEGRILTLENILRNAKVIEENGQTDRVSLGHYVTVLEEGQDEPETFRIVGSAEADPGNGRISNESPLGKALLNHSVGEWVEVETPGGKRRFEILAIA